ncbi:uncharacterized protein N7477_000831 [Penicillium maclennaniae]|uniref:uncharacterized protein n=1 Tax=Penicillium maclennaniae TaxID=1343394 RepID=UPI00253FDF8E|nr:uncharacterized protein N7477_000831 [Penicillium maclennaniae]KAJ5684486.1 hypothetical protein N7477_000831 [Penicillium maclennaniae]
MVLNDQIAVDPVLYDLGNEYSVNDWQSETTSIASAVYRGFMENGRRFECEIAGAQLNIVNNKSTRYENLKQFTYAVAVDDKQFEAYECIHIVALLSEIRSDNPYFISPIGDSPKHILDLGTGKGTWAIEVADRFPNTTVRGVDLFPPPVNWMPPNCVLEVDDVLQEWTWRDPFDLVHMRILDSAFTPEESDRVYKQCYENIRPGGWIEHLGPSMYVECDDGSVPTDSILFGFGDLISRAAEKMGRPINICQTFRGAIEKAGFVDIQEKVYKWPIGPWPRDKLLKEIGALNFHHWSNGLEGYIMFVLTRFGEPVPWLKDEVLVYAAKIRSELANPRHHAYHRATRIWARKPFTSEQNSVEIKSEQD